jgi:hypothetical protein
MTISTIVSRLRTALKEHTADSRASNRFLWNTFYTAMLLFVEREKRSIFNLNIFQTSYLESEEVNLLEDSCVPLTCRGCRYKLPKGIEYKGGLLYKFLGTVDGSEEFQIVNPSTYNRKRNLRGVKQRIKFATLEGEYLYTEKCYPCLKILHVPTNGLTAADGCFILESEIQAPDHIIELILQTAVSSSNIFVQRQYDIVPDKNPNK